MSKRAFTLVELLAVLVILGVISLIATPMILKMMEDSKKDVFSKSVIMLVNTTKMDIINKNYENEYMYNIDFGIVSNLDIPVSSTDQMNGYILYNSDSEVEYVVHNNKYCVKKSFKDSKPQVSNYKELECVINTELVTSGGENLLEKINSKVPNENDVESYENGQLINLGKYGIRYQGSDPDNYIYFNCENYSNQTSDTCEVWRIIGIVDGKVKLASEGVTETEAGPLKYYQQGPNMSSWWPYADLNSYLNGEYYENLTKETKNSKLISPSKWAIRSIGSGNDLASLTSESSYVLERETGYYEGFIGAPYLDNLKMGVLNISDQGFSAMRTGECTKDVSLKSYAACIPYAWLYNSSGLPTFLMNTVSDWAVIVNMFLRRLPVVVATHNTPVVLHLYEDVKISGGTGELDDPYKIHLEDKFINEVYTYDGTEKMVEIPDIPEGYSVEYINNKATDVGVYEVTAILQKGNRKIIQKGSLTINPTPITINAVNKLSYVGENIKELEYQILEGTIYNNDDLNITLLKEAGNAIGEYEIEVNAENPNYEITTVNGNYTISNTLNSHFTSVPNENDVVTFTNGQLINLGKYGIRYQGSDPDNYIYFNCEDYSNQTSDTCEVWRIIGIVDGKVKIISEEIGTMAWNDQNGDGFLDPDVDINDWNNSTLKNYLNGDYYASLTETTKNLNFISPSVWHLKGYFFNTDETKTKVYDYERTTGVTKHDTAYIKDTRIGIMYPSDFGFASLETDTCLSTTILHNYSSCVSSNWISQSSTNYQWLITPFLDNQNAFILYTNGVTGSYVNSNNQRITARPVLYLSANIKLEGEGSSTSPFKLKVE